MLDYGAEPNAISKDGNPMIARAIAAQRLDILSALLDKGADPNLQNQKNSKSSPMLLRAINTKNLDMVNALLDKGANPDALDIEGNPILLKAIDTFDINIINALLDKGANPNSLNKDNKHILFSALELQRSDVIRSFLDRGANPNVLDIKGNPILLTAINMESVDIVSTLLEKGANPNIVSKDGIPVLFSAINIQNLAITKLLIDKNADVEITDKNNNTALDILLELRGKVDIVSLLIENAKDPEQAINTAVSLRNSGGETLLHLAAQQGNSEVFNKYLDYYLDKPKENINIIDKAGYTPLYWSKLLGHTEISNILTKRAEELKGVAYTKITEIEHF